MLHIVRASIFVVLGFSAVCSAAGTVYESFNYNSFTQVVGNGGGGSYGFSDNWSGDSSFGIAPGGLLAAVPFRPSLGNRVSANAFGGNRNIIRTLSEPIGMDDTTTYISFLMQAQDIVGEGAYNGWFSFTLRSESQNLTVGKESFSNKYKLEGTFGPIDHSDVEVNAEEVHLFVLRADFLAGADIFRLFIDPATGQPEPSMADATLVSFDLGTVTMVGVDGPGAFGFDELRIGSTWLDVTPAPELSSVLQAAVVAFAGACCRIRKAR